MNGKRGLICALAAVTVGISTARDAATSDSPQGIWWSHLQELCGQAFAGELVRFNRDFRADFVLDEPVEAPPPPWGAD